VDCRADKDAEHGTIRKWNKRGQGLPFDLQSRIPVSVWVWHMTKALGALIAIATGAALLTVDILPKANETIGTLGGAVLLSLGVMQLFSEFKKWLRIRQLTKQWRP
jgi:hypothetical protein